MTLQFARDFLAQEERVNESENASLAAMSRNRINKEWWKEEAVKKFPCHNCGELGHFQMDGQKKPKKETKERSVFGSMCVQLNSMQTQDTRS